MGKETALNRLKAATLEVMAYDALYPEYIPLNVLAFIERAQERHTSAEWRAMDCCTMREINAIYAELGYQA